MAFQSLSRSLVVENDVAMVVGRRGSTTDTFTATNKVAVFGMVITANLDTTQNPSFWQVPGLSSLLPTPLQNVISFTGPEPISIQEWHELTPTE